MDLFAAKVIAMVSIGLVSVAIGCVPIMLARVFSIGAKTRYSKTNNCTYDKLVSLLLCFGGGVLFFTTFLHLQPEIRATFQELEASGRIQPIYQYFGLQLSEIVICCGFFFVYAVEEVVHFLLDRSRHIRSDADDEVVAIHRTLSLRRCQDSTLNKDDGDRGGTLASPKCLSISMDFHNVVVNGTKLEDDSLPAECPHEVSIFDHPVSNAALYNRTSPVDEDGSCRIVLNNRRIQHHEGNGYYQSGQSTASLITTGTQPDLDQRLSTSGRTSDNQRSSSEFDSSNDVKGMMRGLIAVLALSIHAIFEGLAVGLEESVSSVWYMFLAIATHKFVIIFCVGMELVSAKIRSLYIFIYVVAFSVVTPLGILFGTLLCAIGIDADEMITNSGKVEVTAGKNDGTTDSQLIVIGAVLQAMAAGTLLYVIFFEVLVRDRSHPHQPQQEHHHHHPHDHDDSGFFQLFAIICGFLFMFVLHLLTKCEFNIWLYHLLFIYSLVLVFIGI